MAKRSKTKDLHPLSSAVRRIREASEWTQEEMARRLEISSQTLSRFERGVQVPRDYGIITKLRDAASDAGLDAEESLFREAERNARWAPDTAAQPKPSGQRYTLPEWRLMHAARIAVRFYPEQARAMEKAAGTPLALVDQILTTTQANITDFDFYWTLEDQLNERVELMMFEAFLRDRK